MDRLDRTPKGVMLWSIDAAGPSLTDEWTQAFADPELIATVNWNLVLEQAIDAMSSPDPASEVRRLLRELAPTLVRTKSLLPRTRAETLQIIAILVTLMGLWITQHSGDQRLSERDMTWLAHQIAVDEQRAWTKSRQPICSVPR